MTHIETNIMWLYFAPPPKKPKNFIVGHLTRRQEARSYLSPSSAVKAFKQLQVRGNRGLLVATGRLGLVRTPYGPPARRDLRIILGHPALLPSILGSWGPIFIPRVPPSSEGHFWSGPRFLHPLPEKQLDQFLGNLPFYALVSLPLWKCTSFRAQVTLLVMIFLIFKMYT